MVKFIVVVLKVMQSSVLKLFQFMFSMVCLMVCGFLNRQESVSSGNGGIRLIQQIRCSMLVVLECLVVILVKDQVSVVVIISRNVSRLFFSGCFRLIRISFVVVSRRLNNLCGVGCLFSYRVVMRMVKNIWFCSISDDSLVGMFWVMLMNSRLNLIILRSMLISRMCLNGVGIGLCRISSGSVVRVKCRVQNSSGGKLLRLILIMMKFRFQIRVISRVSRICVIGMVVFGKFQVMLVVVCVRVVIQLVGKNICQLFIVIRVVVVFCVCYVVCCWFGVVFGDVFFCVVWF